MLKLSMDFSCIRVNMYVKAIKCFFYDVRTDEYQCHFQTFNKTT